MSFESLKGQDSAVGYLKASLRNNRISHAYIFSGPDGVGKRLAAINFAKTLNCGSVKSGEPCDQCASCKKIDSSKHPDIFILKPKEEGASMVRRSSSTGSLSLELSRAKSRGSPSTLSKVEGSIKIEDVRALIRDVYLKPFEAHKKVYMIESAEYMKHEAANALLKTLEEPPADSVIILLTKNTKSLFHTIVSRCQVVKFFPLKLKEVEEILTMKYSLSPADAHTLSHLSGGRLGEALKFKEEDIFTKRSLLINKIVSGSRADFDFDDIPKEDVKVYLDMILAWYSDILKMKAGARDYMLVNIDKIDSISNEAKKLSFEDLEYVISDTISTISYLDQNANQKLAMSVLGLKINAIRNTQYARQDRL
ncbi:MAG: DNA polymerase III subunit delta' [Candidatus Omnitrophica bacterium]|nr:DNA polymerase III subunit delta' [Candidatus Omnitrophota bacterium]